ncbi:hypothetical protein BH10BDE1_BH10BDE1_14390 [soil metagenome]
MPLTRSICLFCVLLFAIVSGTGRPAHADPITPREAAEWESFVRGLMKWDASVDLRLEAAGRRAVAEKNLTLNPQSRVERRDLADALHTLGHMSEHEHRFEFAISFHMKALESFLMSGLESRESWDDGTEHAKEHIFMDIYDEGVLLERKGDVQNANRYFDSAAYFALRSGIANSLRHKTDRFDSRFEPLQMRLKQMVRSSGEIRYEIGRHVADVFQEVQCKVLFGNP